jgi:hypothetical protein
MTLFEYMSVAMSLIVALTFAEGLRGLRSALDPERRYWVHAVWLLLKLYNPVMFWWYTWGVPDRTSEPGPNPRVFFLIHRTGQSPADIMIYQKNVRQSKHIPATPLNSLGLGP